MKNQDQLQYFEELAMGSRLKRLSDRLMKGTTIVYQQLGLQFDPYHMPIFKLVSSEDNLTIGQITTLLKVTQPAVTQYVNSLIKKNLFESKIGEIDKRKRKIKLSTDGKLMLKKLNPVWVIVDMVVKEMTQNSKNQTLLEHVSHVEQLLDKQSFSNRILEKLN